MATLEALTKGARVRGIVPDTAVSVVDASWFGNSAIQLTYRVEETGTVAQRLLYRGDESTLLVAEEGATWAFDGDGSLYRLVLEAYRIRLAFPVYQREEGRFEITHVSAEVRRRACTKALPSASASTKSLSTWTGGPTRSSSRRATPCSTL